MNFKHPGQKHALSVDDENFIRYTAWWSRGSSVSTVSGYGLDYRAIEVRSPAEAKDFSSSLYVQTGSEAHPASCTMGTGGPSCLRQTLII
jgi:hypothetical protein